MAGFPAPCSVDSLREFVTCPVCWEPPRKGALYFCPRGHLLCASCRARLASSSSSSSSQCPQCRSSLPRLWNRQEGKSLLSVAVLDRLSFNCRHEEHGCPWIGLRSQVERHEKGCEWYPVRCGHDRCVWEGARSSLSRHGESCKWAPVACRYAGSGCEWKGLRMDARRHEQEGCKWAQIKCRYAERGCAWRGLGRDEADHAGDCDGALIPCFVDENCPARMDVSQVRAHVLEDHAGDLADLPKTEETLVSGHIRNVFRTKMVKDRGTRRLVPTPGVLEREGELFYLAVHRFASGERRACAYFLGESSPHSRGVWFSTTGVGKERDPTPKAVNAAANFGLERAAKGLRVPEPSDPTTDWEEWEVGIYAHFALELYQKCTEKKP